MTAAPDHEIFMKRCIELARMGEGRVMPNPMVGAVLVHEGRIIGEGYHEWYGHAHAEVNCVKNVASVDRVLIPLATMYVSLEPCAHHGKTPPCADLIVNEKIPEVVIGCIDTFSEVSGHGIKKMKAAGIQVITGVLEQECRDLNRRFFTFHERSRPYIILKWAQTADGYIGTLDRKAMKVSNSFTDRWVHRWRSQEAAILVGPKTAIEDNPSLNTRLWPGASPIRIILDPFLGVPTTHNVFNNAVKTIVVTEKMGQEKGVEYWPIPFDEALLPKLMEMLHGRNLQSILVEGGAKTLQQFIDRGLWDEARVIISKNAAGSGWRAPVLTGEPVLQEQVSLDADNIYIYRNRRDY
ncbi:bifunctional diaminohydroxyphosphoribosylaminopyrimidine deaminase/5-amino-6-(5-phosphoribosylamino)uracil reductase RibD [Chitinophaga caeni]|nr:bifunctional diaminohydroxyphosphoribosylaminopyrimidine deaminase/5-amino-6-(5-phosphoribosylamino)uracil reductase RibD [Chitinophaga caeni]